MGELNILITGGAGFIGSNLIEKLIQQNHNIIMIKRKSTNLFRLASLIDKIKIYESDISDIDSLSNIFEENKIDIVYHLATFYKPSHVMDDINPMINTNILGLTNLLELCTKHNIMKFINTGTCFEYKMDKNLLNEKDNLSPWNLYALTKITSENIIDYYSRENGIRVATLRLFPPYGPKDNINKLIPYIIIKALKDEKIEITKGEQRWDYIFVDDIIDAYLKLLTYMPNGHEIYNVGTGTTKSIKNIIETISAILDKKLNVEYGAKEYRKNEIFYMKADITKIKNTLGWLPKTDLKEGLTKTINYYREELNL
ncbi:MAG: SDR family NAD(P)-dependent oxidoreductase [Thermoanaerobacteraceae bacterium]|nr:SDR family NAD(P)-dependent oxidoreductase [Thermoanaerobacteraceae bacterium]